MLSSPLAAMCIHHRHLQGLLWSAEMITEMPLMAETRIMPISHPPQDSQGLNPEISI
jgi:hypothetical protein